MASSIQSRLGATPNESVKAPVVVASNAALTLSGEQTVNAVAVVTGDRVLVKDQADATTNGIYVVSTTAWARAPDWDSSDDVVNGVLVLDTNSRVFYSVQTADPYVIGGSTVSFVAIDSVPGEFAFVSGVDLTISGGGNLILPAPPTSLPVDPGVVWSNSGLLTVGEGVTVVFSEDVDGNIVGGVGAGAALTTGLDNFIAGVGAGASVIDKSFSVYLGNYSGSLATTGIGNVAVGYEAMYQGAAHDRSVAIGNGALRLGGGADNTAVGYSTGAGLADAAVRNTIVGKDSMRLGGAAIDCVAIGYAALESGSNNQDVVAIGTRAMRSFGQASASFNVGIGNDVGASFASGVSNVIIGDGAMPSASAANRNVVIGAGAAVNMGTGFYDNVFIGQGASYATPSASITHRLVIDNKATDTPLIDGNFLAQTILFNAEVTVTGDTTFTSGNITLNSGNITLNSGNLTLTVGDLTLDGNLTTNSGDLDVVVGRVFFRSLGTTDPADAGRLWVDPSGFLKVSAG